MGKRGNKGGGNNGIHTSMSIREEASGKRQSHNPKSVLKLNHLRNLAVWATGNSQPPALGAFFCRSFAEFGESLGIPPDPSLFSCQRCETILQPGVNCTIRIEKNQAKRQRRTKLKAFAQNNVVYTCHFCTHRNLKRGTPKGYVKEIAPSKFILSKNDSVSSAIQKAITTERTNTSSVTTDKSNSMPLPSVSNDVDVSIGSPPANPTATTSVKLLDSKRKRKKASHKKSGDEALVSSGPAEIEKGGGTSKRRRKSWSSLKEIAEKEENERKKRFTNFSIPFVLT